MVVDMMATPLIGIQRFNSRVLISFAISLSLCLSAAAAAAFQSLNLPSRNKLHARSRTHAVDVNVPYAGLSDERDDNNNNASQNDESNHTSASDRRQFLKSASATIVAAIAVTSQEDAALAAPDVVSATSATTPSIDEGELSISDPPPNRGKVVISNSRKDEQSQKSSAVPTKAPTSSNSWASKSRFFIAGGASAAISHGVTTPIDVLKTKQQADPELYSGNLRQVAQSIIEKEGPSVLLKGLAPTVVGYGLEGALKFGVYESLKPTFIGLFPDGVDPTEPYLAAAVVAGALASIVLCPMEETRIRLVTDPNFGKGLLDGLPRLLREEGFFATFAGLPAMLSKQVPYTMGKQVSFDTFAAILYSALSEISWLPRNKLSFGVEIGAALAASIVACLASHPGDVILTATYRGNEGESKSLGDVISRVYQRDGGIQGFFRGLNTRIVHVGCIVTSQLVVYSEIKNYLASSP